MKNQQRRRALNWREIIGLGVLLSLLAAMVYVIVVLVLAPAHTQHIFERTKGDYVLMLLQCLLGIVALGLPALLERKLEIVIPSNMMIVYTLFLYGAIFLGEVMAFYYRVPHWDTILHAFSGAMLGALGYSVVSFLNRSDGVPIELSPLFVAFFAFCFSMTMGMLWEVYEFTMDALFGTNMQKFMQEGGTMLVGQSALADTMKDIIVDAVGALVVSVVGYISLCREKIFVTRLLVRKKKKEAKNA